MEIVPNISMRPVASLKLGYYKLIAIGSEKKKHTMEMRISFFKKSHNEGRFL